MKTVAVIVAAGRGERFGGDIPKQFRKITGRPLLAWTMMCFEKAASINEMVLVVAEEYMLYVNEKIANEYRFAKLGKIVKGGASRQESVYNGLKSLPISTGYVAIHDGARPAVASDDIDRVVETAHKNRAAILARPISETVKRVEADFIISTLDRTRLYLAETPQVFQYDLILSAHEKAAQAENATDDAYLVESLGFKVKTVIPRHPNVKVTIEEDLTVAESFLGEN